MKTLVAFYSKTGNTKKIAGKISEKLNADLEEIIDLVNRKGFSGFLSGGRDGLRKKLTKIKEPGKNPADYDLIIIGTPIWGWNMTPAARTYLAKVKGQLKKLACFCTEGSSGGQRAFENMAEITGLKPEAVLEITEKDLSSHNWEKMVDDFIKKVV
jgi:flavodoxin